MNKGNKLQKGYIALTTVLFISAMVVIVGTAVSLLSVNDLQSSFSSRKSDETVDFVEACVEDALIRLNETGSIPSSIALPQGSCTINPISQAGNDWDFTVTGTKDGYTRKIRVQATRSTSVTVNSWEETP